MRDHPSGGKATTSPQGETGEGKYHNQKTVREVDGNVISFDSQKEARRFDELLLLWRQGVIRDLKMQEDFTLQEAYTNPKTGERVRAIRYRADFTYLERVGDDFGVAPDGWLDTPQALRASSPIVGERHLSVGLEADSSPQGEPLGWRKVVEDVKSQGTKTRVYEIKRKLLRERFGLEIREV